MKLISQDTVLSGISYARFNLNLISQCECLAFFKWDLYASFCRPISIFEKRLIGKCKLAALCIEFSFIYHVLTRNIYLIFSFLTCRAAICSFVAKENRLKVKFKGKGKITKLQDWYNKSQFFFI